MSTTFNYSFVAKDLNESEIHHIIGRLHAKALELPFKSVSKIVDLSGDEHAARFRPDDSTQRLLTKAQKDGQRLSRVIGFLAELGDGEGALAIALALYSGDQSKWSWNSICQTWVSGTKKCGGIPNFLRCHLSVAALLDCATGLGMEVEVAGAANYWRYRDIKSVLAVLRQQISNSELIMAEMARRN